MISTPINETIPEQVLPPTETVKVIPEQIQSAPIEMIKRKRGRPKKELKEEFL